jgi:p25-alpha
MPEAVKPVAVAVSPSPPPAKASPKTAPKPASPAPEPTKSTGSGCKRSTPRLRFSSKPDQVVSIRVDARPTYDSSRLRASLSTLQGIVRGQALIASASYDEALLSQTTDFVSDVVRLQHASYIALGHHQNVVTLSNFFVEVVNMLEANGPRLEHEHAAVLRRTRVCLREACEIAESCNQPGWLVRMTKGEAMSEEFSRLHSTALTLLRAAALDAAPRASIDGKVSRLPEPNYANLSKSVRKMLTSLGEGSMEAGIKRLRDDEAAREQMAKVADVPVEAIQREATLEPFFTVDAAKIIENGAARDAEFSKVFSEYVTTSADAITADGFEKLMTHMGLLDGMDTYDKPSAARAALVAADSDYDGALNFVEFTAFYSCYSVTAARLHLRMTANLELEYKVREVFKDFTQFGSSKTAAFRPGGNMTPRSQTTPRGKSAGTPSKTEPDVGLDCTRFAKLCRDCDLLSWGMTAQHVDVVYTASKPRSGRRLDFDHFLAALALVADRRSQSLDQVAKLVTDARGPALRGTKTDFVSLHDDPSKIIGISARGGPHSGPVNLDLSALVARSCEPGVLPKASGLKPTKTEPTKPQSPKLATGRRTAGTGPCTPGRGVSLQAAEAKAAAKAAALTSPKGPHAVFGRTCTIRAAELANSCKKKRNGGAATPPAAAAPKATVPAPQPVAVLTYTASRQLFTEPVATVEVYEPVPETIKEPVSPPRDVSAAAAFVFDDDDKSSNSGASPIAGAVAAAPVFEDPFKPVSSVAMMSFSSVAMKSLGSLPSEGEDNVEQQQADEENPLVLAAQVDQQQLIKEPFSQIKESPLARSDSTAALAAMFASDPNFTVDTSTDINIPEAAAETTMSVAEEEEREEEQAVAADTIDTDEQIIVDESIIA